MAAVQHRLWEGVTVGGEMFETCVCAAFKSPRVLKKKKSEMFEKVREFKSTLLTSKGLSSVCILMWTLKVELYANSLWQI